MTGRIAAFPPRILEDRNPYARLLYREMERLGFETIDSGSLELGWLWRTRHDVDILHFHWDPQEKYVKRAPDGVTLLLRRLRQERLVPWWDLVSFVARLAVARTLGYRLAWTIHEISPHESDEKRQDIIASRALARMSHWLIAHDEPTAERARNEFSLAAKPIQVIPHGSYIGEYPAGRSRDLVRTELGVPHDAFVFLAFGHLRQYKELPMLIAAFASLPLQSARLIIAGVPWDAGIREVVTKAAQRDERILMMLGPVAADGVAELFGAADTAVFTRGDGWTSGSLILAMSMGVPVIAAQRAAYAALMDGDTGGWLFDPASRSSLAESLSAAAANPESAQSKGDAAFELASRMTWAASAAMLARLIAPTSCSTARKRVAAMASAVRRA